LKPDQNETVKPDNAPNIIVLFVESLSAELVGAYGGKHSGLTPNIDDFAAKNILVTNYYNHVFPTIVGLKGQLCSSYPARTAGELQNMLSSPKQAQMRCLPAHLNDAGYKSVYLSYSHPSYTFFEDQMNATGFNETLFFQELSDRLLNGELPRLGRYGLDDRQTLTALINYLSNIDENDPYFIALSTVGTHPGLDSEEEFAFGDKSSRVLNVLHRFDSFFGEFMEAYNRIDFKRETILILTADHAHLPSAEYVAVASENFTPSRLNKVVFITAFKNAPRSEIFEANTTGIDFAKTVLALAGVSALTRDHLLGSNAFGVAASQKSLANYGEELLIVDRSNGEIKRTDLTQAKDEARLLRYIKALETRDRLCCPQNQP
jgi:phosphoglycerol transferase MdoB-like AlkP superfamily enzyme